MKKTTNPNPKIELSLYPWLENDWNKVCSYSKDKFPHALIIAAPEGYGKLEFARLLSQYLNCRSPSPVGMNMEAHFPCGQCQSCILFQARNYVDYKELEILEKKKTIGVDQIREVIDWVHLTSQSQGKKILLIPDAQKMTLQSANALLKTLEEPPADTIVILLCEHIKALLPTIRSRCQHLIFEMVDKNKVVRWLEEEIPHWDLKQHSLEFWQAHKENIFSLVNQSPLKLKQLLQGDQLQKRELILNSIISIIIEHQSPTIISEKLIKEDKAYIILCLYSVVTDLIRVKFSLNNQYLINTDILEQLNLILHQIKMIHLFQLQADLNEYFSMNSKSLNEQLLLDSFLIKWHQCTQNVQAI